MLHNYNCYIEQIGSCDICETEYMYRSELKKHIKHTCFVILYCHLKKNSKAKKKQIIANTCTFCQNYFQKAAKKVKAEKRIFVYDNCCNFHKHVLRRYPWKTRNWIFVVDRHHYKNHKLCSAAYNMVSYKWMKKTAEQ